MASSADRDRDRDRRLVLGLQMKVALADDMLQKCAAVIAATVRERDVAVAAHAATLQQLQADMRATSTRLPCSTCADAAAQVRDLQRQLQDKDVVLLSTQQELMSTGMRLKRLQAEALAGPAPTVAVPPAPSVAAPSGDVLHMLETALKEKDALLTRVMELERQLSVRRVGLVEVERMHVVNQDLERKLDEALAARNVHTSRIVELDARRKYAESRVATLEHDLRVAQAQALAHVCDHSRQRAEPHCDHALDGPAVRSRGDTVLGTAVPATSTVPSMTTRSPAIASTCAAESSLVAPVAPVPAAAPVVGAPEERAHSFRSSAGSSVYIGASSGRGTHRRGSGSDGEHSGGSSNGSGSGSSDRNDDVEAGPEGHDGPESDGGHVRVGERGRPPPSPPPSGHGPGHGSGAASHSHGASTASSRAAPAMPAWRGHGPGLGSGRVPGSAPVMAPPGPPPSPPESPRATATRGAPQLQQPSSPRPPPQRPPPPPAGSRSPVAVAPPPPLPPPGRPGPRNQYPSGQASPVPPPGKPTALPAASAPLARPPPPRGPSPTAGQFKPSPPPPRASPPAGGTGSPVLGGDVRARPPATPPPPRPARG
jgi:hypothetical protein